MLYVGESTVHQTRQKFVDGAVEFALREAPRLGGKQKLDGKAEAFELEHSQNDGRFARFPRCW
ncbi:hypothetical protein [Leptothermofonsia sp. ETS-13]|uniref:hypothetical protein n=1 Tax=Leptothermofonsia sp. ETS-13 TaxID=3035696 RepID=UPI003B9EFD59